MKTFVAPRLLSLLGVLVSTVVATSFPASAEDTHAFTYQGQLRDGGTNANGTYALTFKIYDAPGGGNQVGGTVTAPSQLLVNGLFTVNLDFGDGVFTGENRWLAISVSNSVTSLFEVLMPRVQVLPVPYALFAGEAETVVDGAIMNAQLAASAVANGNLQDNAVSTAKIQNNSISTAKIQDNAVTTVQVASGAIANRNLAADAVNASNVASGQVVKRLNGLADLVTLASGTNVVLATNGNTLQISAIPAVGSMQVFYANGNFVVPTNVTRIMVELWGGGGGGGMGINEYDNQGRLKSGGGGGGAEYVKATVGVTPGGSYTVTVGQGGSGGVAIGSNGSSGQSSSFGGLVNSTGGGAGNGAPNYNGGLGGGNGNQDPQTHRVSGANGQTYYDGKTGGAAVSGGFGGGGTAAGFEPGGGGSGDGGRGGNGRVIIYY